MMLRATGKCECVQHLRTHMMLRATLTHTYDATCHRYVCVYATLTHLRVWVLLFPLSAHTRPVYPTHFAGSPYTARATATITPI